MNTVQLDSRVFVAGHAGLIGSAIVRRLECDGYRHVITRTRAQLDLADAAAVTRFFTETRPEFVLLAAGRVGGIGENLARPAEFIEENLAIQLNVLKASRQVQVTKLILFGSSCMYPRDSPQPMSEGLLLSGQPEPTSLPYAVAKLAGMHLCLAYNKQDGVQRFLPVIPNSAYGPHDDFDPRSGHVLSSLMARFHEAVEHGAGAVTLWGSGSPRREFVHADDIADACLHLCRRDVSDLQFPVNIGVGSDISIKELAEAIAALTGFEGRLDWDLTKPDGAPRKLLDSTRIQQSGWRPKIAQAEGLRMTYQWYLQHCGATRATT